MTTDVITIYHHLSQPRLRHVAQHARAHSLIDKMLQFPILINRPIVITPWGVKLCRPSETVLDILPLPQKRPFEKEDGEVVIK